MRRKNYKFFYYRHYEEAIQGFKCDKCGQVAGQVCITTSGIKAVEPHRDRMNKRKESLKFI